MTKGYTKLFADIITSSIWSEDNNTRIMWITMLASSDASGYVSGTIPGMAAMSRLSLEDAEKAIKILCDGNGHVKGTHLVAQIGSTYVHIISRQPRG